MSESVRLDAALVARGLVSGRDKAKACIADGAVTVNGRVIKKAALTVSDTDEIVCTVQPRYVGRGGEKLEKVLDGYGVDLTDLRCADIGASTGGFTDCMLQHGAAQVYALDVGHGQLHERLQKDARVISLEGMDVRDRAAVAAAIPDGTVAFCSVDVSFISLTQIWTALCPMLTPDATVVCLIKPQFEAGRQALSKHGVVKDAKAHIRVLDSLLAFWQQQEMPVAHLTWSPVRGGEGNIEYLAVLSHTLLPDVVISPQTVVRDAMAALS